MNYIVFDMEWNMPAWSKGMVMNPVPLTGEIIEIGAVKLNDMLEVMDEFRIYVAPQYYKKMNRAVQRLTRLHADFLQDNGVPFPEAYRRFAAWCGEDFTFASWGQNDLPMLLENLRLHGIRAEGLPACIDLQNLLDREILHKKQQCSLDDALLLLGETGDEAHDALHDARNTVKVCMHLSLDGCEESCKTRIFDVEPQKKEYRNQKELLRDRKLKSFTCPHCREQVACDTWVKVNDSRWMAVGVCPKRHEFILYLNFHETKAGRLRTSRMLYEMTEDLRGSYRKKLKKQRRQQSGHKYKRAHKGICDKEGRSIPQKAPDRREAESCH